MNKDKTNAHYTEKKKMRSLFPKKKLSKIIKN